MHSIIRQGQFHGQLHGQFHHPPKGHIRTPLPRSLSHAHPAPVGHAGQLLGGSQWERRGLVRSGPESGRIDVCRLIVAMLGLGLYLAIPVAAVSFALNMLFG